MIRAGYAFDAHQVPFAWTPPGRVFVGIDLDRTSLVDAEGVQEGFLVLSGECTLIVEDEERPLRQWDYFHCPADTSHVIVGAGHGPCAILMVGARTEVTIRYPVSEVAAKYGASVAKETSDPNEAYADWPGEYVPVRLPWPLDSESRS